MSVKLEKSIELSSSLSNEWTIIQGIKITTRMIKIMRGMTVIDMRLGTTITDMEDFKVEADISEIVKTYHVGPYNATHA